MHALNAREVQSFLPSFRRCPKRHKPASPALFRISFSQIGGRIVSSAWRRALYRKSSIRSHNDITGLITFVGGDDWQSWFDGVMDEHFGPAMQEFALEYEAIGAALRGWDRMRRGTCAAYGPQP